MNAGGVIVLATSVIVVVGLAVFCFWRLLTLPDPPQTPDDETGDAIDPPSGTP